MSDLLHRQRTTLALLVVIAIATPVIAQSPFWTDNVVLFGIFSLFALSVGMAYGQGGILSMATGAFGAIGGFATAILTTRYGASPLLGLVVAVLLPMVLAYPLARVVTRLSPLPLSIATLVLGSVIEIAIREGGDFTGGYIGLSGIPAIPYFETPLKMLLLSWGCVTLTVFVFNNLKASALGRAVATARHDPLRAVADGVSVPNMLAVFFALSAAVAGLGGWLYAHNLSYLGPDSLNATVSMQVLLMAIVGGVRHSLGPVVGSCLLLVIVTYLPAAESQGMVFGAALVAILLVAPQGVVGFLFGDRRPARPVPATDRTASLGTAPSLPIGQATGDAR
jgi:branched-chain amino acid transport system permease protein